MCTRCHVDSYSLMAVEIFQGIFHNFYVFRIKEKEIPVDTVEVKGTFEFI